MRQALGTALRGGLWSAAGLWAVFLFVLAFLDRPPDLEEALIALGVCTLAGGVFGFGAGLAVGCARLSYDDAGEDRSRFAGRGKRSFAVQVSAERPGLSWLDLGVASVYGLTFTALSLIVLLVFFGGPRGLIAMAMNASPFASLGPGHAKLMLLGTLQVVSTVPLLVLLSRRPPLRRLERFHVKGVTASGFVAGLVWPGLLLTFLV